MKAFLFIIYDIVLWLVHSNCFTMFVCVHRILRLWPRLHKFQWHSILTIILKSFNLWKLVGLHIWHWSWKWIWHKTIMVNIWCQGWNARLFWRFSGDFHWMCVQQAFNWKILLWKWIQAIWCLLIRQLLALSVQDKCLWWWQRISSVLLIIPSIW